MTCFQWLNHCFGKKLIAAKNGAKPDKFLPDLAGYICSYRNGKGLPGTDAVVKPEYLILWRDQNMTNFINFLNDEDGAVTVDWVVLTAAIVGLGVAGISSVQSGVVGLAENIGDDVVVRDVSSYN